LLYWKDFPSEISEEAIIHPKAYIADKNVRVGRGTVIEPGVTILERTVIGEDVILRAGCTLGSQGFEFKRIDGKILNVAHAGGLMIGNRVEIQANSALSRSIFGGFTELGEDTKLDNLVHIAHNVTIGKRCFLAACAMIAGSVSIGNDVWIGPGASISSGITIGDDAQITIGSVVTRDVLHNQRVTGNFAIEHKRFLAFLKSIR
jgi:UDP-3-O-[3-hydroxymyristoyl] glucosamine N-acyltransferase